MITGNYQNVAEKRFQQIYSKDANVIWIKSKTATKYK